LKKYPESIANGLVFNENGDILLIKTDRWKDKLTLPGGHVEIGESLKETVQREVNDKLGVDVDVEDLINVQEFMMHPDYYARKHMLLFNFSCKIKNGSPSALHRSVLDFIWVRLEDALVMDLDSYSKETIKNFIENKKKESGFRVKLDESSKIKINL